MEQDRKIYENQVKTVLDEWARRIEEMHDQIDKKPDSDFQKSMEEVVTTARMEYEKLQQADDENWKEQQLAMESVIERLRKESQKAFIELQNEIPEESTSFEIQHQVKIDAPIEKVYEALTTKEGLKGWWTLDVEAEPKEGSTAIFGFDNRSTVFRMHVKKLNSNKRVVWKCSSTVKDWDGTTLNFEIIKVDDKTILNFTHSGWDKTGDTFRRCNTDWGHLMYYLKDYAEGNSNRPLMN